jgi:hypothetical protein
MIVAGALFWEQFPMTFRMSLSILVLVGALWAGPVFAGDACADEASTSQTAGLAASAEAVSGATGSPGSLTAVERAGRIEAARERRAARERGRAMPYADAGGFEPGRASPLGGPLPPARTVSR